MSEKKDEKQERKGDGTASRMEAHNAVRRSGGSPREAIRAYCQGNKWLTENAKAVGNW
jgi:hypothetical protein